MMHLHPAKARQYPGQLAILTRNAEHGEGWPISGDRITSPLEGPFRGLIPAVDWACVERDKP